MDFMYSMYPVFGVFDGLCILCILCILEAIQQTFGKTVVLSSLSHRVMVTVCTYDLEMKPQYME